MNERRPACHLPALARVNVPCSRSLATWRYINQFSLRGDPVVKCGGQYRDAMLPRSVAESSREETAPATGGCMVLSRMSFASKGVVYGTQPPMGVATTKSKHDALGFPILSLLKELLEQVCYFLDPQTLGTLHLVSKHVKFVAESNEFWKQLSIRQLGLNEALSDTHVPRNNWKAEFMFLRARAKRTKEYPRLYSQGLVGKISPVVREKEENISCGHSFREVSSMFG